MFIKLTRHFGGAIFVRPQAIDVVDSGDVGATVIHVSGQKIEIQELCVQVTDLIHGAAGGGSAFDDDATRTAR